MAFYERVKPIELGKKTPFPFLVLIIKRFAVDKIQLFCTRLRRRHCLFEVIDNHRSERNDFVNILITLNRIGDHHSVNATILDEFISVAGENTMASQGTNIFGAAGIKSFGDFRQSARRIDHIVNDDTKFIFDFADNRMDFGLIRLRPALLSKSKSRTWEEGSKELSPFDAAMIRRNNTNLIIGEFGLPSNHFAGAAPIKARTTKA
jgi:hypothetical protein